MNDSKDAATLFKRIRKLNSMDDRQPFDCSRVICQLLVQI